MATFILFQIQSLVFIAFLDIATFTLWRAVVELL